MSKFILVLLCALLACGAALTVSASEDMIQPIFLEEGESLEMHLSVDRDSDAILAQLQEESQRESQAALDEAEFHETESEAFVEMDAEADADSDVESETETETETESEAVPTTYPTLSSEKEEMVPVYTPAEPKQEMTSVLYTDMETPALLEVTGDEEGGDDASGGEGGDGGSGGGGGEGGANPSYTLPYPPVLPGHYTPLFNPYSNVNPLSTPFANYAAQPGAHPGVAAAAAAQAGSLAAINGQIAGVQGGYYPYAHPYGAAVGSYAGWIHPQNLNSASVGENEDAASLGQFIEVATEETEHGECSGCEY